MPSPLFLRRRAVGQYLKRFDTGSEATLAKLDCGGGPKSRRVGTGPQASAIYTADKPRPPIRGGA
jgi:hypothetical protein